MRFVKQKFTTDVSIDYNEFIDCEFENCTIVCHGGPFSITGAKMTQVRFGVADAANNTLLFLRFVRDANAQALEELFSNVKGASQAQSGTVN